MKAITYSSIALLLLSLNACKPPHHPKNPNYGISKPKVKYNPSKENLQKMVTDLQGSPYVWAEEGPNNFDCSGFTYYMYGSMGIEIPRVAREQAKKGTRIKSNELVYGDLIFFDTERRRRGRITHVGMYLGDGWFTHASTIKYEIVYSNLNTSPYYKQRLRVCRRYLPQSQKAFLESTAKTNIKPWKASKVQIPSVVAKKPSMKEPSVKQQNTKKGNFYVQVGSYSGRPHSSILYKISAKGYSYKVIQFPHKGNKISKLLIGPYSTHAKAESALGTVKKQIQKSAFIAEIR
ncbi:MAG: hypothetical protein GQ531_09585 [Sulfurovum sp.]|nr:hypothetical protein [Sulfurovum sp.]